MVFPLPDSYPHNLHKWQCNDKFIAGRFAYEIPNTFASGTTGSFEDTLDVPPYTISGNHTGELLVWLNRIAIRHDLEPLQTAVSPHFNADGEFLWRVDDGVGGFNHLYDNGDTSLVGYAWNTGIWEQIRDAIIHTSMAVNITPPHEVGQIVEEEEETDYTTNPPEYWWENGIEIRKSRWFTEENVIENGLWMPPAASNPLARRGMPPEIHLMQAQTTGIYGAIGQYGVLNTEEYMTYFKKPCGYSKGDFFNFSLAKTGDVVVRLMRNLQPPMECQICNTVYKYVTWYRKEFENSALGFFTYAPNNSQRYPENPSLSDLSRIPDYIDYDFDNPVVNSWTPTLNAPVICASSLDEDRFILPEEWVYGDSLQIWKVYSAPVVAPKCLFNGSHIWHYDEGCFSCNPGYVMPTFGCTIPFISLPYSQCATHSPFVPISCSQPRLYYHPNYDVQWYLSGVTNPTAVTETTLSNGVDFDNGWYWLDGPGIAFEGNDGTGGWYSKFITSKNSSFNDELDFCVNGCYPEVNNGVPSEMRHSFYDQRIFDGGSSEVITGLITLLREHSYYVAANEAADKLRYKISLLASMGQRSVIPTTFTMGIENIDEINNCRARWDGSQWLGTWTRECYLPLCGDTIPCGPFTEVFQANQIPNTIPNQYWQEYSDYSENIPSGLQIVHIPYIHGVKPYSDKILRDVVPDIYQGPPTLYRQNGGYYGVELSHVDTISVGEYLNNNNVVKLQYEYNVANPGNNGQVNLGAEADSRYMNGYWDDYSSNDLTVVDRIIEWDLEDRFKRFPAPSSRWEFTMPHWDDNWQEFRVDENKNVIVIGSGNFNINQVSQTIQQRLQTLYDSLEYEFKEDNEGYPVQSFMLTSSKVRGDYGAFEDEGTFTFLEGYQNEDRLCSSSIDIFTEFRQNIHVSATYLNWKTIKNKFGIGLINQVLDNETGEVESTGSLYRGKIMFGHGTRPLMTGRGAFPIPRVIYERNFEQPVGFIEDMFDIRSFAEYYPLDYWIGKVVIAWGYAHLDEYDFETDTWVHKLPDSTSQEELYNLVAKRIGDVLDNSTSQYGQILNKVTFEGDPTLINASNGDITIGDIVDFSIDMKDIIDIKAGLNSVFFIAHYVSNNPTAGNTAKFIVPRPIYHWQGNPINEETLYFQEDYQVYGVYADIFENTHFTETTATQSIYDYDHDANPNTPMVQQTEKRKRVDFTPYFYPSGDIWFGTPSGHYPAYKVNSRQLTFGDAERAVVPYQGRFGDVVTWIGSGVSEGYWEGIEGINRPASHIAFRIVDPLYKVGDRSAGGNTHGNIERPIQDNDQLTPIELRN